MCFAQNYANNPTSDPSSYLRHRSEWQLIVTAILSTYEHVLSTLLASTFYFSSPLSQTPNATSKSSAVSRSTYSNEN